MLTVVTVVLNRVKTIKACLTSVETQDFRGFKHLIFDGGSTDGTLEVLKEYVESHDWAELYEIKDTGIYDALNQAVSHVRSEYFMFLHSDDKLIDQEVLKKIANVVEYSNADIFCGGVKITQQGRVVRTWDVDESDLNNRFWTPPHTGCVFSSRVSDNVPIYRTDLKISSDYDYLLRLKKIDKLVWRALPFFITEMEGGGASGLRHTLRRTYEDYKVVRDNGMRPSILFWKYLSKLMQFLRKE